MRPEYEQERGIIAGIDGTWERSNCIGNPSEKGKSEQIRVGPFLLRAGHTTVEMVSAPFGISTLSRHGDVSRDAAKRSALVALRSHLAEAIDDIDAELAR